MIRARSFSNIVISALLLFGAIAFAVPTCLSVPNLSVNAEGVPNKSSAQTEMRMEVLVKVSESCSLFDPEVENPFFYKVSAVFSEPLENSSQLSLYLPTKSVAFIAIATYRDGTQRRIQPTLIPLGYGADTVSVFYFDSGLNGFEVTILGNVEGLSLLWRNMVDLRLVAPSFSQAVPASYKIQIEVPNSLEVTSISSSVAPWLKPEETLGNGSKIYTVLMPISLTVYYRPVYWTSLVVAVIFLTACAAILVPYLPRRAWTSQFHKVFKKADDLIVTMRRTLKVERLFTLYITCSLLMVSLSLVAGPDPRIKIYAVAPPYLISNIEEELSSRVGPVQVIGPQDTVGEFETIANLGVVKAVIVSYYPKLALDRIIKFTLDAMDQVPLIVVDEYTADPELARDIKVRFGDRVIAVQVLDGGSFAMISKELQGLRVKNPLGLELQVGPFKAITALVAVLSLLVVFFGLAFLSSRLIEAGRSKGLGSIPEAIMLPGFVFYFTQVVYMVSSVLLAMPIGLHAVTSGSKELTAIGLLGFGGGSSPRAVFGVLGFFFGVFVAIKGRSEIDKWGITAFVFLIILLIVDPFTGGELFYDALLFFLSGPRSEIIRSSIFYTKDILSNVGRIFGGWVTGIYGLSTGEILFYAWALPTFLFPITRRSTATFLLLISGFAVGSGFIRTAEMTPFKTVASLIPGLAIGLAIVVILLVVSFVEGRMRARL